MLATTLQVPRISAAVCARNEARFLPDLLASLREQSLTDCEFLVVDSASSDATCEILGRLASSGDTRLRVFRESRPGLSRARNRALREARAPVVAFVDADAVVEPHWLEALAQTFERHPGAAVVGGTVLVHWDHPRPRWWRASLDEALNHYRPAELDTTLSYPRYPYGTNFAVRRRALDDAAGGFAGELGRCGHSLLAAEEGDLCLRLERAGWEIRYAPAAVVRHRTSAARLRRRYILRRAFHHGRSQFLLEARNGFESGRYPSWPGIAWSLLRQGGCLGLDLPFLKYITFRIGYQFERSRTRPQGAGP